MHLTTISALKAVLLLSAGAEAFWRMPCKGRTGLARIDPLVNFGTIGDHVHAIHGSNGMYLSQNVHQAIQTSARASLKLGCVEKNCNRVALKHLSAVTNGQSSQAFRKPQLQMISSLAIAPRVPLPRTSLLIGIRLSTSARLMGSLRLFNKLVGC